ncbi:Metallo-dependent phosphatase-like protein [Mycena amicta]|nr:Metallo-dependent phosphatase-like protein [Mycena amicta]
MRARLFVLVASTWLGEAIAFALQHPLVASPPALDPYPDKPRITFRPDGTFKLTIFSDLHFAEDPDKDANSARLMRAVLWDEQPDYAVINGDLITGDDTLKESSTLFMDTLLAPLIEANVPFSCSHGNHDNHVNITHMDEILREQLIAPLSYTRAAPLGVGGSDATTGAGNYWVPIYATSYDSGPTLILWFFDSRGGVASDGSPLPDWVDASVAEWVRREQGRMEVVWGSAAVAKAGAISLVHIPPHAIQALQPTLNASTSPGLNDDKLGDGSVQDSNHIAASESTATRDEAFWHALNDIPNLHVVISGHAHGNEWCAHEPSRNIIFCFNKHSGYGGYDKPGWGHGVRNLVVRAVDPGEGVETWIRLEAEADGDGDEETSTRARVLLRNGQIEML